MRKKELGFVCCLVSALAVTACRDGDHQIPAQVTRTPFGTLPDGREIDLFTLTNAHMEVRAIPLGGIIVSIRVPDRTGRLDDIALGYDTPAEYVRNPRYFGAIVGRYANRIANGRFSLDGRTYQLATNNGANHLHGGVKGFDKVVWKGEEGNASITFTYRSVDGEEGYPGTLDAKVRYELAGNALTIDYWATTDKPTVVNLTQHTYFNLAGQAARDVLDHELQIEADHYTPVDERLIPTGEIAPVEGTPLDFRKLTRIGARIDDDHVQLRHGRGYDHNFVLRPRAGGNAPARRAARVVERSTGRTLEVATTEPGMQFYSGNFLDGSITGKQGRVYNKRYAFCLETQHFPNSPNYPHFPSTTLRPGQQFHSQTVFTFGVE
jgi:aldose 1-epimerase